MFAAGMLGSAAAERSGIISGHAYWVIKEREVKRERFVFIRYDPYARNVDQILIVLETYGDLPSGAMVRKSGQLNG